MKHKTIAEALGEIDQKYIAQAATHRRPRWGHWVSAAAAVLAVALLVGLFWNPADPQRSTTPTIVGTAPAELGRPVSIQSPDMLRLSSLVAAPAYPQMVKKPNAADYAGNWEVYYEAEDIWKADQRAQYRQPNGYADSLAGFWNRSLTEFLSGQKENAAYSPVNVYMALAMLAETAESNSRQQILDLLALDSIEELRTQVNHVWNAHYSADGATTTVLANSIWLDSQFAYKQAAVDTLANTYFSSVFHGDLGTEDMNTQLRQWIDSQTGGLLQEQTQALKLDPSTLMALASTVYFSADWTEAFSEKNTAEAVFHSLQADIRTQFMNQTLLHTAYYWGQDFGAVCLEMSGGNAMWLILPDEGKTVDDVLSSGEYLRMCTGSWSQWDRYTVHLSMPKFDISSQMDLVEGMQNMGVTDVFDPAISDFSAITDENLFVGKIDHACRIAVDEEGCVAAAYTVMAFYGTGMPEIKDELDFVLDRPFLFVITSRDNLPLFAGVVNQP